MTVGQRASVGRTPGAVVLAGLAALSFAPDPQRAAEAQEAPRDRYLRFVPLDPPRIVSRTSASARFALYGDREHPDYRDRQPRDGIDDRRHERLGELAVRFSPYLMRNTGSAPLHFRSVLRPPEAFPLYVERWDAVPSFPPGSEPSEWKEEYYGSTSDGVARAYRDARGIYCHPVLRRVPGEDESYELVLQYWFFYPFNDGGDNHEGDWEHMNVVLSVAGEGTMRLDFLDPDVRLPREEWEGKLEERGADRVGEHWIRRRTREMTYADADETRVNIHPVGYIGADNKGLDQLLSAPGGTNRDSHGTYPFPGLYKDVGPAGAAEEIGAPINPHCGLSRDRAATPGRLERLDRPDRIEIVPDWERVADLVIEEPDVRRRWAWLLLPIRWGYPSVRSRRSSPPLTSSTRSRPSSATRTPEPS